MIPQKELLWGLWVDSLICQARGGLALVLDVAPDPNAAEASLLFVQRCRPSNTPFARAVGLTAEQIYVSYRSSQNSSVSATTMIF